MPEGGGPGKAHYVLGVRGRQGSGIYNVAGKRGLALCAEDDCAAAQFAHDPVYYFSEALRGPLLGRPELCAGVYTYYGPFERREPLACCKSFVGRELYPGHRELGLNASQPQHAQIVLYVMHLAVLAVKGYGVCQKGPPKIPVIACAHGDSGQGGDERGIEGVLKQHGA